MRPISGMALAIVVSWLLTPLAAAAGDAPTCQGRTATIVGTAYADSLHGTSGDDVAWLGGTADEDGGYGVLDRFDGGGGSDLVCQGGFGAASVYGGEGDDEVHLDGLSPDGDIHGLQVIGGPGADILVGSLDDKATLIGGDGHDSLTGGDGADSLTGGAGADRVVAAGGDDYVYEGPGSDVVDAGEGADSVLYSASITGLAPRDYVDESVTVDVASGSVESGTHVDSVTGNECWVGTSRGDTMTGSAAADCLYGAAGKGRDKISAGGGDDLVYIQSGTVDAGEGEDTIRASYAQIEAHDADQDPIRTSIAVRAGRGDDHVVANGYRMTAAGEGGRDVLDLTALSPGRSTTGWWRIDVPAGLLSGSRREFETEVRFSTFEAYLGSHSDDRFQGSAAPEHFAGGAGRDIAVGGRGNDVLVGGPDADLVDGGPGRDRCRAERRRNCELPA